MPLSADEEAFLRAFMQAVHAVPRAIEADLLADVGISGSGYAVLVHLSEAPRRRMRMSELARRCGLTQSGITRTVDRLEAEGLVEREPCQEDARGWNAVLTRSGMTRLRRAWPAHLASVRRHMIDHLRGLDLAAVSTAVQRFATDAPSAQNGYEPPTRAAPVAYAPPRARRRA